MGGKGVPGHGNVRGKDGGDIELHNRINETERIAKLARETPQAALTTLAHHIDIDWLRVGVSTHAQGRSHWHRPADSRRDAHHLDDNLRSLLERAKSGSQRGRQTPGSKSTHTRRGDGSQTRPIGIPTFEDKVLQRAVAMVLEAVYEQSFLGCLRLPTRTLGASGVASRTRPDGKDGGQAGAEVDIDFFGTLDHSHLRNIVRKRVRDGVLLRLIGKWLNAA